MMVMESGIAVPFVVHPTDDIPGEVWFNRMPGLLALTRMLRYPEFVFGEPSERESRKTGEVIDWEQAPLEIRRYLEHWGTRCAEPMLLIEVAANIVRRHGVKVCRGEPAITFLWEEGTMTVIVELSIDALCETVNQMSSELMEMTLFLDIRPRGFSLYFTVGEGGEADMEASLEKELEQHRALGLELGD